MKVADISVEDVNKDEVSLLQITHLTARLIAEGMYYNDIDKLKTGVIFLDTMERFNFSSTLSNKIFASNLRTTYMLMHKSDDGGEEFMLKTMDKVKDMIIEFSNHVNPIGKSLFEMMHAKKDKMKADGDNTNDD